MLCHDEAPFVDLNALPTTGPFAEAFGRNPFLQACGTWNVGSASALTHTPVRTSIPTLILHGMYDGYYPPSTSIEGAQTLRRSFVYTIPGFGSGALAGGDPCPLSILGAWIDDPTVAPDVSCLANMPKTVAPFVLRPTRY
jgi:hypothetical protein